MPGILLLTPCFAQLVKEMRLRLTRSANLARLSCGDDGKEARQEVPKYSDGDDHEDKEDLEVFK